MAGANNNNYSKAGASIKPSPTQQKPLPDPSPSDPPFPFLDNHGPPPVYGFQMLDRRSIGLADGSVRSYFALPPQYQDFETNGRQGFEFRNRNQDYWINSSLGQQENNFLKRKFVDEGEERYGIARQRQQLLQYGNAGLNSNVIAGTSSVYGREDAMRGVKYMRGEEVECNVGRNKYNEVDQEAVKKAFFRFVKLVYEDVEKKKKYLVDGKEGPVKCVACSRSTKDYPDTHSLIMHTYNPDSPELLVDHLGLHKALCILMGWNYLISPDNLKKYQLLSADEAAANQEDLIMWPPHVIIHNTMTGKGIDGRIEGLGNRAMDTKLRELGFSSGKSNSLYGREGHHLGITLVKFSGHRSGLKAAMRLGEFFEKDNRGRQSWAVLQNLVSIKTADNHPKLVRVDKNTGEKERILYGYLATASDFDKIDVETKKRVVIESKRVLEPF